jgi:hypothetical protein
MMRGGGSHGLALQAATSVQIACAGIVFIACRPFERHRKRPQPAPRRASAGGRSSPRRCSVGRNGRGFAGTGGNQWEFNNLPAGAASTGALLGPTLAAGYQWNGYANTSARTVMASDSPGAFFDNAIIGSNYIGFRFLSGTDLLYGWAELILSTTGGGTVTVNRWAYNDTPDGSIEVGQTQDAPTPAPAPSTLVLLAAGAFGVRRWRARRAAA